MKKYFWIAALIAALAMVMVGCDNGDGGGGGTDTGDTGKYVTEFVLTDYLKELVDAGAFSKDVDINEKDAFDGLKFQLAGDPGDLIAVIKDNNGKLALEFETDVDWGAGFDLLDSGLKFQAKDKITVKGRILADFPAGAPSSATWATPVLYMTLNGSDNNDRPSIADSLKSGAVYETTAELVAKDVKNIGLASPAGIRIGARPSGVKYSIDEIIVERFVPDVAAPTYTVTYYKDDKTTELAKVENIASGAYINEPKLETWFTTYINGLADDKELAGWYTDPANTATLWDFNTNTVIANVSLYAVLETIKPATALTVLTLNTTNGQLTGSTDLTNAKYLVVKFTTTKLNGIGGRELGYGSTRVQIIGDWTGLQPELGTYNGSATIYLSINLANIAGLTFTTTSGPLILRQPDESYTWNGNDLTIDKIWLADGKPKKAAANVNAEFDGIVYGWFANDIDGLDDD